MQGAFAAWSSLLPLLVLITNHIANLFMIRNFFVYQMLTPCATPARMSQPRRLSENTLLVGNGHVRSIAGTIEYFLVVGGWGRMSHAVTLHLEEYFNKKSVSTSQMELVAWNGLACRHLRYISSSYSSFASDILRRPPINDWTR